LILVLLRKLSKLFSTPEAAICGFQANNVKVLLVYFIKDMTTQKVQLMPPMELNSKSNTVQEACLVFGVMIQSMLEESRPPRQL